MNITLQDAKFLFKEAHDFSTGKVQYMSEDSTIRQMAENVFGHSHVFHLYHVCNEIFRVIAEDAMKEK